MNWVASQAFSRRLLMKASTLRFDELTFSSPGYFVMYSPS
jgi:hypothetical protein